MTENDQKSMQVDSGKLHSSSERVETAAETADLQSCVVGYPSIIVQAFGDEPVVLYAVKMQDNGRYVNVGRVPPYAPIGWPIKDAFDYDVHSYADLVSAYEAKDKGRLAVLYDALSAKPKQFIATLSEPAQEVEITT